MQITLSAPHVIEGFETLNVEVLGFHINYERNHVLAIGKNDFSIIFEGIIIDDLEGADLSIDNFLTLFQTHIESTYDAAS